MRVDVRLFARYREAAGRDRIEIELPSDGTDGQWPRYLDLAGVRVYLIVARGRRLASASNLDRPKPIVFSREDFVEPD